MSHNSIAGWIWLGLALGGIGYGATQGLAKSRLAQIEIDKEQAAAEAEQLTAEMRSAIMLAEGNDIEGAVKAFERLATIYPKQTALWLNMGIAYRAKKDFDRALQSLEHAAELSPNAWDVVAERASVYIEMGKVEEALELAERIPPRRGQMAVRLRADPAWVDLERTPRMQKILASHGIGTDGSLETGESTKAEIERQRRSYPDDQQNPK